MRTGLALMIVALCAGCTHDGANHGPYKNGELCKCPQDCVQSPNQDVMSTHGLLIP
ncbi:MAG: hypothetical protein ISS35_02155 [Kiritimatiellae bacterium]|nr:hypothetical protein [Kiritimatiellia bacterium]